MLLERHLLLIQLINVLAYRIDEFMVGHGAKYFSDCILVTLLLADQLGIFAIVLQKFIIVGLASEVGVEQQVTICIAFV